ncbi:alpha/beta fold hydrolase, partial [Streptomyces palmae]
GQYETAGPREEGAYAQPELARDVLAQVEALGRGVHVLGHSLGGLIVRAAALLDASGFASLTLMSSGPAAISASQRERTKLLLEALGVLDMASVWQAMRDLDPPEAPASRASAEVREFLRRRWMSTVPEQLIATGRQLMFATDQVAELAAVAPARHVVSGEVDYAWPVALLDAMADRLDARRTVIAGAGHSPNAEQPLACARALADFWEDVTVDG